MKLLFISPDTARAAARAAIRSGHATDYEIRKMVVSNPDKSVDIGWQLSLIRVTPAPYFGR